MVTVTRYQASDVTYGDSDQVLRRVPSFMMTMTRYQASEVTYGDSDQVSGE